MDDEHSANPFRRWSAQAESDDEPEPDRAAPARTAARSVSGWYPDPTGIYSARYWDGTTWTDGIVDRNRATSTHHPTQRHAPPRWESSRPTVPIPTSNGSARAASAVSESPGISDPYAVSVMERLIDDDRGHAPHGDVLVLTAQILQRASERAGIDWDGNGMTIDGVVDALPADLAEATVRAIHALYEPSGDDENARWTEAKLNEIRTRKTARRHLRSVTSLTVTERTDTTWLRNLERESAPVESARTPPIAPVTPSFEARPHAETLPPPPPSVPDDSVPDARETAEPRGSAKSFGARIRSMRNPWMFGTVVFVLLAAGYLLLPVNETSTSIDGTRTVHLGCGSVVSPHASTARGAELASAASLCDAARQPNESRAIFFGFLALVSGSLAAFAMMSDPQSSSTTKSQPTSEDRDPPGAQ